MPGLLGTLELGTRSLQTQQQGVEVAGHNLSNVNNPAYARQRLQIQTSPAVDTGLGPQGTGVSGVGISRLRNQMLDDQIQSETSVSGYLEAVQKALQYAQADLGQTIDTQGQATSGTSSTASSQNGLAEGLTGLFNAFQSVASEASSPNQRQALLMKAADLAAKFNQVDQRLANLQSTLSTSVTNDTASANDLLAQIAELNTQISRAEAGSQGANDLRDLRQQKIEGLAQLVNIDVGAETNGMVNISIAGSAFVTGQQVVETLETYDAGAGQILVRAQSSGTPLTLTGGSIAGTIDVRDGQVTALRQSLDTLAASLISEVNALHRTGFNLEGGTGADFFIGTGAADIQVNPALVNKPALVQASGVAGTAGDNQIALALARLADKPNAALLNQTFAQSYGQTVATLGQSLSSVNTRLEDQASVEAMLSRQRDSVSGVSLDEEMTDMMKYQKAFQASARLISTVAEMLDAVLNMKH